MKLEELNEQLRDLRVQIHDHASEYGMEHVEYASARGGCTPDDLVQALADDLEALGIDSEMVEYVVGSALAVGAYFDRAQMVAEYEHMQDVSTFIMGQIDE